jgi:hypothetical protein
MQEDHLCQFLLGLALAERHGRGQGCHRFYIHEAERAGLVGRIGTIFSDDLDDADDPLLFTRVVEEDAFAAFHRLQVLLGEVVAHTFPRRSLRRCLDLIVPRPGSGLGLQQPVRHASIDRAADDPTPAAHFDRIEKAGLPVRIFCEHRFDPVAIFRFDDQHRADHGRAVVGQERSAGFDRLGIGPEIIEMRGAVGKTHLVVVRLVETDGYIMHGENSGGLCFGLQWPGQ